MIRLITITAALGVFLVLYPPGMEVLDAKFAYPESHAFLYISLLGPAGRLNYLIHEMVDLGFLAGYTAIILIIYRNLTQASGLTINPACVAICLLPGCFDLSENLSIIFQILTYPTRQDQALAVLTHATPMKWLSAFPVILLLLGSTLQRVRGAK